MKNISIAFCVDENMYMQTGVAIASLLSSSKGKTHYDIYCINPISIPHSCHDELASIANRLDPLSKIIFISAPEDFDDISAEGRFSRATYYRFALPVLLPNLNRVIYADSDMVFLGDLRKVWRNPANECSVAAVAQPVCETLGLKKDSSFRLARELANLKNLKYFNAGFLVINLDKMRKKSSYNTMIALAKEGESGFVDQNILNWVFHGDVALLPPKYNAFVRYHKPEFRKESLTCYSEIELDEAWKNPVVVHYIGKKKPWLGWKDPWADHFWKFARLTPFFNMLKKE